MSLRFVFGSSGAGKSYHLYNEIIKRAGENPGQAFLVIVPDQFTMQTQKELVLRHPDGVIMNIDVLSFGRLSHRIFEEVGYDKRPILDDTGKSLVLRKIVASVQDNLPVLGGNLNKQGYIHEVKSAISEFMQYGIGVKELSDLVDFAKSRGALYYKLKDLQTIYDEFLKYIQGQFITTEETLDLLKNSLSKSRLVKDSVVVFDGFTGFTPIQNRLIQELMHRAAEVIVTVTLPENEDPFKIEGEQELFYLSKKTVADLCKLAREGGIACGHDIMLKGDVPRFAKGGRLAHLEKSIFRYPVKPYGKEEKDSICLYEASDPKEEVRQTAMKIRRLIREEGYQFREIAVVCGDLGAYADHVEEQFGLFGIPLFLDQTRGIMLNPFIEYIRSAMSIYNQDFSYESVFHYLRSGLADFTGEEIDWFENYVLRFNIRGSYAYSRVFTKKTKEMGEDAESFDKVNEFRERLLASLKPLHFQVRKQTDAAARITECGEDTVSIRVKDYVEGLYDFLVTSHVQEKLAAYEKQFEESGELSRAREYAQIYPLVMDLLDQIIGLLGDEIMSLKEFADILDAGFGEIEVGTIPQNVDRVVVGDIERTRLKPVRALFFIGVNDGNIPKGTSKGGIISDIDREFLRESEWELAPSPRQQMYIQRLYLYLNMTKPSEKLFLSCSKMNGEGKAIRPAYLMDTMHKLFPDICVEYPQLRPAQEQLETPAEGLHLLAEKLRQFASGENKMPDAGENHANDIDNSDNTLFFTLLSSYENMPEYKTELEKLVNAAFYRYRHHPLAREVAHRLYGQIMENSVTRLETYASCAYAHFLEYGLSLKEREEFSFDTVDMGNIFHTVLETFAQNLASRGLTWFSFNEDEGEEIVTEALEACSAEYGDTVLFASARNEYIIKRMKRILTRTVMTLQNQLQKGSFTPDKFEMSFSTIKDLDSVNISLSEKERMLLKGRIDRIDTLEEGDKLYVKVIDYKSGNKQFDLVALYYGLQLQLVVYLNAAMDIQKKLHPEKEVLPAALLYYHVSDPLISTETEMSPEELNQKILSELKMTGVVNDDTSVIQRMDGTLTDGRSASDVIPIELKKDGTVSARSSVLSSDELTQVSNYVNHKIRCIGKEIMNGNLSINPYEKGSRSACTFCAYHAVCGFDKKIDGFKMRNLTDYSKEEVLDKMAGEIAQTPI